MRMTEGSVTGWLIIDQSASILSAHCMCMAGAGEVCSHVAAIAFFICFEEMSSCTSISCQWNVPKTKELIEPKRLKDIDWGQNVKTKAYTGKISAMSTIFLLNNTNFIYFPTQMLQRSCNYRNLI